MCKISTVPIADKLLKWDRWSSLRAQHFWIVAWRNDFILLYSNRYFELRLCQSSVLDFWVSVHQASEKGIAPDSQSNQLCIGFSGKCDFCVRITICCQYAQNLKKRIDHFGRTSRISERGSHFRYLWPAIEMDSNESQDSRNADDLIQNSARSLSRKSRRWENRTRIREQFIRYPHDIPSVWCANDRFCIGCPISFPYGHVWEVHR